MTMLWRGGQDVLLQRNTKTLEFLTERLKGQLDLLVPGEGESLQLILMVQREHLNQDPFGLQPTNCKTARKTLCFLFPRLLSQSTAIIREPPQPSSDHSAQLKERCSKCMYVCMYVAKERHSLKKTKNKTKLKNLDFWVTWKKKNMLHFFFLTPQLSLSQPNCANQINRQLNFPEQGRGNNSREPAHCAGCTVYSSNSYCLKQSD